MKFSKRSSIRHKSVGGLVGKLCQLLLASNSKFLVNFDILNLANHAR